MVDDFSLDEAVPADGTTPKASGESGAEANNVEPDAIEPEDEVEDVDEKLEDPVLLSLDDMKEAARQANTEEGLVARATPFPLTSLGCEVMVGKARGQRWLDKVFKSANNPIAALSAGASALDVDTAFVKMFIIDCVVKPEIDEEFLDLLIGVDCAEFQLLANFCMSKTMIESSRDVAERLGVVAGVDGVRLFFGDIDGSGNSSMPA